MTDKVQKHDATLGEMKLGVLVTRDWGKPTEGAWEVTAVDLRRTGGPWAVHLERRGEKIIVTADNRDQFDLKIADDFRTHA